MHTHMPPTPRPRCICDQVSRCLCVGSQLKALMQLVEQAGALPGKVGRKRLITTLLSSSPSGFHFPGSRWGEEIPWSYEDRGSGQDTCCWEQMLPAKNRLASGSGGPGTAELLHSSWLTSFSALRAASTQQQEHRTQRLSPTPRPRRDY